MVRKLKTVAKQSGNDKQLADAIKGSAQDIWLAGLGAFTRAQEEGQKMFKNLVRDGNSIQKRTVKLTGEKVNEVTSRVNEVTSRVTEVANGLQKQANGTWDKLEGVFEARVERALSRLGVPTSKEVSALSKRVDELSRSLSMRSGRKVAVKRATARRSA